MEDDYSRFRRLLVTHRKRNLWVPCGSLFELPFQYMISNPTDVDFMYWASNVVAYQPRDLIHGSQRKSDVVLKVDSDNCHAGFARLRKTKSNVNGHGQSEFYRRPPFSSSGLLMKGPSLSKITSTGRANDLLSYFGRKWTGENIFVIDKVYAVRCAHWPPEADEWISRERRNGWPSRDYIDAIVKEGCQLVFKPHQSTPDDETQWRYSFSYAELVLIHSWSDVQKYVYHILRLVKKEVVENCGGENESFLCTYYFKTLMFWACEEKPPCFWKDENLETSVGELLCQMIEWLIDRRCPNYFIPDNNMIDHLPDCSDLSSEINWLLQICQKRLPSILSRFIKFDLRSPVCYQFPNKLRDICLVMLNSSFLQNFLNPKSVLSSLPDYLGSVEFAPELRHLYDGIRLQIRFMKLLDSGAKISSVDMSSALKCFDLADEARMDDSVSPLWIASGISLTELMYLIVSLHRNEAHFFTKESEGLEDREDRSLAASISKFRARMFLGDSKDITESLDRDTQIVDEDDQVSSRFKKKIDIEHRTIAERFGRRLFVEAIQNVFENIVCEHPSLIHLVTTAYRANFEYNALQDYGSARDLCRNTATQMKCLNKKLDNSLRLTFPVLLANEWSLLFDKYIQVLLGFTTLFQTVSPEREPNKPRCRSIVIQLDPVAFLEYIHFQSSRSLGELESVVFTCNIQKALLDHMELGQNLEYLSQFLFITAIRISGIKAHVEEHVLSVSWHADSVSGLENNRLFRN